MLCPNCKVTTLEPVSLPFTPPWRCGNCLLLFWHSQLTEEARAAWRSHFRDFGAMTTTIMAAVRAERHLN